MAGSEKLGRITVNRDPSDYVASRRRQCESGKTRRSITTIIAIVLLSALVYGGQVLAAQVRPQRVVIRGCWLTQAEEILGAVGYGTDNSFANLRRNAASLDSNAIRWLRAVAVEQDYPRTAVLTVEERYPVLRVESMDNAYWLCDDGELVRQNPEQDTGDNFTAIAGLPTVRVSHAVEAGFFDNADTVMTVAACCNETMPGMISLIEIDADCVLNLYDRNGFRILLGQPEYLPEKIGALPKALRLNENERDNMRYLDASNVNTFYEKWKEPIS